jgi:hypothetical protein
VSARSWIAPVLSTRLALQPPSLPPSVYSLTSRRLYSVHTPSTPPPTTTLTPSPSRLLQSAAPQPGTRACFGPKPHSTPLLPPPSVHTPPPILIALSARTYHDPADTAPLRRPTTSSRSRSPGRSTTPSSHQPVPHSDSPTPTALTTRHATLVRLSKHRACTKSCCLNTPTKYPSRPSAPRISRLHRLINDDVNNGVRVLSPPPLRQQCCAHAFSHPTPQQHYRVHPSTASHTFALALEARTLPTVHTRVQHLAHFAAPRACIALRAALV